MKRPRFVLSLALLCGAILLLSGIVAKAQQSATGCHSKGVEVHTFYGATEDVLGGMDKLTTDRANSRLYMLIVESPKRAEIRIYEKTEAEGFTVSTWRGASVGDLRLTLDRLMLKTRGSACAGEEMKNLLASRGINLRRETASAMPVSSRAAFSPVIEPYRGYLRVTVLDPCRPATRPPANVAINQ